MVATRILKSRRVNLKTVTRKQSIQSLTKTNIYPLTCGCKKVRNASFWKTLLDLLSCNHHFKIHPLPYDQRIKNRKHKYYNIKLRYDFFNRILTPVILQY